MVQCGLWVSWPMQRGWQVLLSMCSLARHLSLRIDQWVFRIMNVTLSLFKGVSLLKVDDYYYCSVMKY